MSTKEKISLAEACAFLECAEPKLLELIHRGVIPAVKPGKAWVIPRCTFFTAVGGWAYESARAAKKQP